MKAVILAGGKGTRLRPMTYAVPKPLLPVAERPILAHILLHLKKHGIKDFIFTIGYLGYQIKNYFGDGSEWGVNIEYVEEKKPLGTAGCLRPIKDKLDETFLVVGADNLTTMNYTQFIRFHRKKAKQGGVATIALTEISVPVELGIYEFNKKNLITSFKEKPTFKYAAGTMIFCLEPEIFKYIPKGVCNLTDHVVPKLLKAKKIYGWPFKEFWMDVGSAEEFKKISPKTLKTK